MTAGVFRDVPIRLTWLDGRPIVTLRDLPVSLKYEPFWEDTLKQAVGGARLLPLDRAPDPPEAWRPAGSIFHMQRCGSTLACHLLGAIPGVRALSEPMVFQELFIHPAAQSDRHVWLRRLLELHRAALCSGGEALMIKWSSLNILFASDIAAACAGTPAVFMWRNPVEVLVSGVEGAPINIRGVPAGFFAPHMAPASPADIQAWPLAELLARFQGSCCYHATRSGAMRLMDYRSLPAGAWERLAPHFGLPRPSKATLVGLGQIAELDAKDPDQRRTFASDTSRKQASASDEVRALAVRFVEPELTALRERHAAL